MVIDNQKIIEQHITPGTALAKTIIRFGVDPYILMLCIGALGHRLTLPVLFKVGFFEALLAVLIVQSISSTQIDKWKVTNKPTVRKEK